MMELCITICNRSSSCFVTDHYVHQAHNIAYHITPYTVIILVTTRNRLLID